MNSATPSHTSNSTLEEVKQQFITWRKNKTGRARIPEPLWQAAAEVFHTGDHSLHKISKTLRLNHSDFKKYVYQQSHRSIQREKALPPAFIELEPPTSASECVIEMETTTGAKMRVCLRGKTDSSLIEICNSFWRQQR
ncbi:MAG: hypothetical protein GY737_03975 [Desulfobacteraceae bacterium]|nr:hypothetical protein [Desulfobacteraceae bacterium]